MKAYWMIGCPIIIISKFFSFLIVTIFKNSFDFIEIRLIMSGFLSIYFLHGAL